MSGLNITVREPNPSDMDKLLELIVLSTDGRTKLTKYQLHRDLFVKTCDEKLEIDNSDATLEIDPKFLKTNSNVIQSIIAEVDGEIAGFIITHHAYSPWTGNFRCLDELYEKTKFRGMGVAEAMVERLIERTKQDELTELIFVNRSFNKSFIEKLFKTEAHAIRNEETDWSVLRINF